MPGTSCFPFRICYTATVSCPKQRDVALDPVARDPVAAGRLEDGRRGTTAMSETISHTNAVDLRSDTVTRPTAGMREAMARADVGDDVFAEDPTVNALEQRAADLFGKEAALFVPSGTMANLLAVLSQTRPGDSIILSDDAHPFNYESGNLGMVAGVLTRTLPSHNGIITADQVAGRIVKKDDHHYSNTTLVGIENTSNRGGGSIYPVDTVAAIGKTAHEHGLRFHCDGARIFNAIVETNVSPKQYAEHVDTLSFCLSKGLGAPVGSLLLGDKATIWTAHRYRKMLGGGMRQAGILAAAGLYALDHHVERLRDDHRRAREFRERLDGLPGISFPLPSPTNMVYVDVCDADAFAKRLAERNVLVLSTSPTRLRIVFHLDINDQGLAEAVDAFRSAARS